MNPSPIDLTTLAAVKSWLPATATTDDALIQGTITAASAYWLWKTGRGPQNSGVAALSPFNQAVTYTETYDGSGTSRQFLRNTPILSVVSLSVNGVTVQASTSPAVPGYVIDGSGKSISIRGGFGQPAYPYGVSFSQLRQFNNCRGGFPVGMQNVQVQYTAGFAAQAITDELDTIPATPGPYTILTQARWLSDTGVKYFIGGAPLTKVLISPAAGQYFLQGGGVYLFNAADQGAQVLISYQTPGTPPDIELACRQQVIVNYKRRGWVDQKSQIMNAGAGTIIYRDWELPPEVMAVMEAYKRTAQA